MKWHAQNLYSLGELLANKIQSYTVFTLDHVSVEKVTTSASIPNKLLSKDLEQSPLIVHRQIN